MFRTNGTSISFLSREIHQLSAYSSIVVSFVLSIWARDSAHACAGGHRTFYCTRSTLFLHLCVQFHNRYVQSAGHWTSESVHQSIGPGLCGLDDIIAWSFRPPKFFEAMVGRRCDASTFNIVRGVDNENALVKQTEHFQHNQHSNGYISVSSTIENLKCNLGLYLQAPSLLWMLFFRLTNDLMFGK